MTKKPVIRPLNFMKPKGYENHLTITELSKEVGWDISWIRKLESQERIPKARRIHYAPGSPEVRLWSPRQVREIKAIKKTMKPGRPKGGVVHGRG